ncbi:MAG TPA: NYN domain-containing protein, partial [Thermoanaerobaculia bacterium]|nr:NYN domain-containing protein [Thermoanaerobaculia bacterium]
AEGEDRDALVAEISDRLRKTRAKIVLFFDGTGNALSLGNLAVRFAGATSADDAILREISRAPRPRETTVVTADRDLARRARDAGAVAVSPQDFWKRFGSAEAPSARRPEETRVNVEEWLEWFSDETNRDE